MPPIDELREKVAASRLAQTDRARDMRHAQIDEIDAAAAHVELENQLECEEWRQAQLDNGVPADAIDADRRVVTILALGPVHVATDEGVVTWHPESAEAEEIRQSPARGVELAEGQPVNPAAHLPFAEPKTDVAAEAWPIKEKK